MTESDYVPFLINDRSSAVLHLIDAFQLTESELHDVYDGVFNRMKEYFDSGDRPSNEPVKEIGIFEGENSIVVTEDLLIEDDEVELPTQESLQEGFKAYLKECQSEEEILFTILPLEAGMLLGVIQSAVINLNLPDNIELFCRKFIGAFGNRHGEKFPAIWEAIRLGWNPNYQKTVEDFDDLMGYDNDDDDYEEDFA